jgi:hypothetical protein
LIQGKVHLFSYVAVASADGNVVLNLSSIESTRAAELEVAVDSAAPTSVDLTTLREAEHALITAELARKKH